jgi:antitoxin (DNA-binding transcriptional repressor) of toxin-antitoxin stability system
MKTAGIAELKNNLSRYLEHVRAGGTVMVLDRDAPVAQIVPLPKAGIITSKGDEARLARLERKGLIRRGKGGLPDWLKRHQPVRLRGSMLRDLLSERESGW